MTSVKVKVKKIYVDIFERKWQTIEMNSQGELWNNPPGVIKLKTNCNSEYTSVKHKMCNNKKMKKKQGILHVSFLREM